MGRGKSKADLLIQDAKKRMDDAREARREAQAQMAIATAKWEILQDAYNSLVTGFAREPRRPKSVQSAARKSKPPASTGDGTETASRADVCAVEGCGLEERYAVHSEASLPNFHAFQLVKPKGAKKKDLPRLPDDPTQFDHQASM